MAQPIEAIGSKKYNKQKEWPYALLALFLFIVVGPIAFPTYFQAKWPPDGIRPFLWSLLPLSFIGFCLWRSARANIYSRIYYGIQIAVSLFLASVPMQNDAWAYRTYPWAYAIPLLIALLIASWFGRQRWIKIAVPGFLIWWFASALPAPTITAPATQSIGGLTVELERVTPNAMIFHVSGSNGFLPMHVWVDAQLGSTIPVRAWSEWSPESSGEYIAQLFAPNWARSINLTLTVPRSQDPQKGVTTFVFDRVQLTKTR